MLYDIFWINFKCPHCNNDMCLSKRMFLFFVTHAEIFGDIYTHTHTYIEKEQMWKNLTISWIGE